MDRLEPTDMTAPDKANAGGHLATLLKGAVHLWGVEATVAVDDATLTATVSTPAGLVVTVVRDDADWRIVRQQGETAAPSIRDHPSAAAMLRGLRAHLQPDHAASRLVITPRPVAVR